MCLISLFTLIISNTEFLFPELQTDTVNFVVETEIKLSRTDFTLLEESMIVLYQVFLYRGAAKLCARLCGSLLYQGSSF